MAFSPSALALVRSPVSSFSPSPSAASFLKTSGAVQRVSARGQYGIDQALSKLSDIANSNTLKSEALASAQREWQREQNRIAMEFNASEAAKNRDWQKMMSDTAHQREIADLKAAGLNPILSAMGGNGAAVTSGATASGYTSSGARGDVDMSASTGLVSILASMLQAQTQIANTAVNANANLAVADKHVQAQRFAAELSAGASRYSADTYAAAARYSSDNSLKASQIAAAATKFSALTHADATKVAASISAAASRYSADMNNLTQNQVANINAEVNRELKQMGIDAQFDLQEQELANEMSLAAYKGGFLGTGLSLGTISDVLGDFFTGGYGSSAKDKSTFVRKSVGRSK